MPKKVLEFSVRTSTEQSVEELRERLEESLGCHFSEGEYEEVPAFVTEFFGMRVALYRWGDDYLLESSIEDIRFLEAAERDPLEPVRISQAVADTLTILGAGEWRISSPADIAKDNAYGEQLEQRYLDAEGPPPWADET
ncbi:hypothetical protein [Streptomyces sp. NPDC056987]|uniref:hypothetical protein n=1 Tax=Streptomyces sp. NPDC056987 TaxID=3345988 RepID=UPI0036418629